MKSQLIKGALAVAMLLFSVGSFTSCKDTEQEHIDELKKEQFDLEQALARLQAQYDAMKAVQDACQDKCDQMMWNHIIEYNQTVMQTYATLHGMNAAIQTAKDALQTNINNLSTALEDSMQNVRNREKAFNLILQQVKALAELNEETIDSIGDVLSPIAADWDTVRAEAMYAYAWVKLNEVRVEKMDSALNALGDSIPELRADITELQVKVKNAEAKINKVSDALGTLTTRVDGLEGKHNALEIRVENLEDEYAKLEARVAQNESDIADLKTTVDAIIDRLDNMITGLILQASNNPVFGGINTPFGFQSNVLMAYYGYNDFGQEYYFPDDDDSHEYDGGHGLITAADMRMLRSTKPSGSGQQFLVNQGTLIDDADANLGRVYVTVNPNNVNFSGKYLDLVNSQDETCPVKLSRLKRSDAVLQFGIGSRAADNGFYEADVQVAADDVEDAAIKVEIDDKLKTSMKNALKNRTKGDFVNLIRDVYNVVSDNNGNGLPAYGLKASWSDKVGNTYATYSAYNIAAATFKPLSFQFLYGKELKNLPILNPISEFDFDLGGFDGIKFPEIKITLNTDEITFKPNITKVNFDDLGKINVTIKDYPVMSKEPIEFMGQDGEVHKTYVVEGYEDKVITADMPAELTDKLKTLAANLNGLDEDIQKQFDTALNQIADQIDKQVQDMMSQVETSINDQINDLVNSIQDKINNKVNGYLNRFNNLIDRYNNMADRLNKILNDPNKYLQPVMVVEGADGNLHSLSNTAAFPSRFIMGSGSAVKLYPTTYTAQIVVPVLKKFVGVTNVFTADGKASAQKGNGKCIAALRKANSQGNFFNLAISGDQEEVAFQPTPGFVYEIVYSALDYHGFTSTRKYYVEVVAE